jgi:hypothetical protein
MLYLRVLYIVIQKSIRCRIGKVSKNWYRAVPIFVPIAALCLKANDLPAAGSHGLKPAEINGSSSTERNVRSIKIPP